jgi:predicted dehydrogenase
MPLLVGHHRRYNSMIQKAKTIIDSGRLGRIVAVHGAFWAMKPDDYFDVAWRREKGAGPILINLIHDVDLFRFLCGEIIAVQAMESNAVRGNPVEDTAAILLRFANGAIGSLTVSDSIVAPWSWELTTGENPAYPRQDQFCYLIGGTHGRRPGGIFPARGGLG